MHFGSVTTLTARLSLMVEGRCCSVSSFALPYTWTLAGPRKRLNEGHHLRYSL